MTWATINLGLREWADLCERKADAQATIGGVAGAVNDQERTANCCGSRVMISGKYESVKNDAISLQSQLAQCTAAGVGGV